MIGVSSFRAALSRFFHTPASARPLGALRIALALVLIAQAYLLRSSALNFLAHDGLHPGKSGAIPRRCECAPDFLACSGGVAHRGLGDRMHLRRHLGLSGQPRPAWSGISFPGYGFWFLASALDSDEYRLHDDLRRGSLCPCFSFLPDFCASGGRLVDGRVVRPTRWLAQHGCPDRLADPAIASLHF